MPRFLLFNAKNQESSCSNIALLIKNGARLETLSKRQYKMLLVVSEVYRQQQWMFENNKQRIEERIVSLSQPYIRPIVRGKAGKTQSVELKSLQAVLKDMFF